MKYWFFEILKSFSISLIIIVGAIFLLPTFIDIKNQEAKEILAIL